MSVVDFGRAAVYWRVDTLRKPPTTASHEPPYTLNTARVPLDSVLWIEDAETGRTHRFVHGVSCKTERVGVKEGIWLDPNADFVPIASESHFLAIKTFARQGTEIPLWPSGRVQGERQISAIADAFDRLWVDLPVTEAQVLPDATAIVNAVLAGHVLVGRTTWRSGRLQATVEYPIKTINANERDWVYQTDTGPILFPDLTRPIEDLIAGMELAFLAVNDATWAEFLVRVPTQIAYGVSVWHYARSVRIDGRSEILRVG